jgi:hypothetical protein
MIRFMYLHRDAQYTQCNLSGNCRNNTTVAVGCFEIVPSVILNTITGDIHVVGINHSQFDLILIDGYSWTIIMQK